MEQGIQAVLAHT